MAIIDKPSDYFNTVIYTGNGAAARGITGVGFQPDWVWVKDRSVGYPHITWDSARTNKASLCTNTTAAEVTTTARTLTSFDSDGFTTPNVTDDIFNDNGTAFVSWNWKAGGTASSNTDGSITSSVSANQDAGFSIVSYTGTGSAATVGHGLSAVPNVIIIKRLDQASNWCVYHSGLGGADHNLFLNTTSAIQTDTDIWNNTLPTTSVFSLGTNIDANGSSAGHIAYCFAEKQGYSKFGSYTGNGSTDGTFVYTGFKPAFVIMKRTDTTENWLIKDSVRDSFNVADKRLFANLSQAEGTSANGSIDILSNGFKQRGSDIITNASSGTYIYMAFASSPFTTSSGVPTTAR
jgi:hypothetical protein